MLGDVDLDGGLRLDPFFLQPLEENGLKERQIGPTVGCVADIEGECIHLVLGEMKDVVIAGQIVGSQPIIDVSGLWGSIDEEGKASARVCFQD